MTEQLQALFAAYQNLTVTGCSSVYVVKNGDARMCEFLMNESGVFDVWLMSHQTCLSQNMVKVLHDSLVLLNGDVK